MQSLSMSMYGTVHPIPAETVDESIMIIPTRGVIPAVFGVDEIAPLAATLEEWGRKGEHVIITQ